MLPRFFVSINKCLLIILMFLLPSYVLCATIPYNLQTKTLNWQPCRSDNGIPESDIALFGSRLSCAIMQAPLDYNSPNLGTINIALSRLSATSKNRKGAIFFNPGGPGGPGLSMSTRFGKLFNLANPEDPTGAKLIQISQEYDLIGFNPRGVGNSTVFTDSLTKL